MNNPDPRMHIRITDDGYVLHNETGIAAYNKNGAGLFKINGEGLPDNIEVHDQSSKTECSEGTFHAPENEMSEQTVKQIRELVNNTTKEAIRNEQRPGGSLYAMQKDGGSALNNCKIRFGDSKSLPYPLGGFPHPKRTIALTVSGLEEWTDGILHGTTVQVSVYQGDKLLRSKVITGKTSTPYTQTFEVNASCGDLTVTHNRPDLPLLKVSAEFVK